MTRLKTVAASTVGVLLISGLAYGLMPKVSSLVARQSRRLAARPATNPWGEVHTPSQGKLGPIGGYSAGCLDGAQAMPMEGAGFQMMRPSRNRFWGHPTLLAFLRGLGDDAQKAKLGALLYGDLGQPRGGPMPSGHASHQIGLDVDIWYWLNPDAAQRPLTPEERENLGAPAFVDLAKYEFIKDQWKPEHTLMLKLAAQRPEVERIFVHATIKRELCETIHGDRSWLHKLRPWYLHHDHFHVRLRCPDGSAHCRRQDPVPEGDGCSGEEYAWWFSDEAKQKEREMWQGLSNTAEAEPRSELPKLPAQCDAILRSTRL